MKTKEKFYGLIDNSRMPHVMYLGEYTSKKIAEAWWRGHPTVAAVIPETDLIRIAEVNDVPLQHPTNPNIRYSVTVGENGEYNLAQL